MTSLFVDASALVAMTTREADDEHLVSQLGPYDNRLYSPIVFWEAVTAIARKRDVPIAEAQQAFEQFAAKFDLRMTPIGAEVAKAALTAWSRYGKAGKHRAQLNMGDCFAYACAKTNEARLLYKGDDFVHTNLA